MGGRLQALQLPSHYDFRALRLTPAELRTEFARLGWRRVVAFQTRNPMHRAHVELTFRAAKQVEANLLIHPSVGMTKPGDVDYFTRVRCYQLLLAKFPAGTAKLSLLPLAMRMGGPREAIWHALIRKNHGCSHFIVGRDHAGPGNDTHGKPFYGPYDAQELFKKHAGEMGVAQVPFQMMVYLEDQDRYVPDNEVPPGSRVLNLSGTEQRRRLNEGREIPSWFTYPEVVQELRRSFPPRQQQGVTIFFTGLSGSGKSTIANVLMTKFLETGGRPVTLLDGDLVRKHLSSELGFSQGASRHQHPPPIGYVASEITKNGGIAICAPIAPYDATRKHVRALIEPVGGFILVHVATPIETCEQRDRKGLYAKARAGILKEFTGISDPYEQPADAEVTINTADLSRPRRPRRKSSCTWSAKDSSSSIELRPEARAVSRWAQGRPGSMDIAFKIFVGFVVGTLIGMTGVGGGVLLLPILIFGLGVPPIVAVGSDAAFNFVTKIGSGWMHLRKGTVRLGVVLALAVGSIPGSILGVNFLAHLRQVHGNGVNGFIRLAVGLLLVFIPTLLFFQTQIEDHVAHRPPTLRSFAGMSAIGLLAGVLVGMTSVGSGSIVMMLLLLLYQLLAPGHGGHRHRARGRAHGRHQPVAVPLRQRGFSSGWRAGHRLHPRRAAGLAFEHPRSRPLAAAHSLRGINGDRRPHVVGHRVGSRIAGSLRRKS